LMFNVVLQIVIRRSKVEIWGTIFDKCIQSMACADDVVVMGKSLQGVEEVFASLVEQTNRTGLETNEKMIVSQKPYNGNGYVNLCKYNFEIVKEYTYLGTILTNKDELRPEIEKRITNANRTYML